MSAIAGLGYWDDRAVTPGDVRQMIEALSHRGPHGAGFWVEGGEVCFPVDGITVAGNLKDMFAGIVEVGNDVDPNRATRTGSVLIERMTIAGD